MGNSSDKVITEILSNNSPNTGYLEILGSRIPAETLGILYNFAKLPIDMPKETPNSTGVPYILNLPIRDAVKEFEEHVDTLYNKITPKELEILLRHGLSVDYRKNYDGILTFYYARDGLYQYLQVLLKFNPDLTRESFFGIMVVDEILDHLVPGSLRLNDYKNCLQLIFTHTNHYRINKYFQIGDGLIFITMILNDGYIESKKFLAFLKMKLNDFSQHDLRVLLVCGLNPNVILPEFEGHTLLHVYAGNGKYNHIRVLLNFKPDISIKCAHGKTALQHAEANLLDYEKNAGNYYLGYRSDQHYCVDILNGHIGNCKETKYLG